MKIANFREHIAIIMRVSPAQPSTARRAPRELVRTAADRGYYPPRIEAELARLESRWELESDEGGTAREKAIAIWNVGRPKDRRVRA
jgi:hypothetical protein